MSETPETPPPPVGAFLDPYKDNNPLVTLVALHDQFKADMVRNRLEAAGIPAVVSGETSATALGPISFDAVTVEVRASDLDRAHRVLAEPVDSLDAEPIPEIDPTDPNYLATRALYCMIIGIFVFGLFWIPFAIVRYVLTQWPDIPALTLALSLPLLIPPFFLFVYSLRLALRTTDRSEELTTAASCKMWAAIVGDGLALVGGALLVRWVLFL